MKDYIIGVMIGLFLHTLSNHFNPKKHFSSNTLLVPQLKTECEGNKCDTLYLYELRK